MFFTSLEGTLKETQYAWPKVAGDKMEQINENTMALNQVGYMNGTLFEYHGTSQKCTCQNITCENNE